MRCEVQQPLVRLEDLYKNFPSVSILHSSIYCSVNILFLRQAFVLMSPLFRLNFYLYLCTLTCISVFWRRVPNLDVRLTNQKSVTTHQKFRETLSRSMVWSLDPSPKTELYLNLHRCFI